MEAPPVASSPISAPNNAPRPTQRTKGGSIDFFVSNAVNSRETQAPPRFPWTNHMPELARQTAAILADKMGAEAVWLFGSYARGEAGPDSDLDFLVVVPKSDESRYERAVEARGYVAHIHVPKDIIVLTQAEWERDLQAVCSLGSTVLREGIQL